MCPANNFAADNECFKVPEKFDDNQAVLLSDTLPTAWHGNELGHVGEGDDVAIWGAGPGQFLKSNLQVLLCCCYILIES